MTKKTILCVALVAIGAVVAVPASAQLMNVPMPDLPANQEMLVLEVDYAPGQTSTPHRHNAHVFVYVLEGTVEMAVAGGEVQRLGPGEMFYESPSDVHSVSRNASDTEPAKILVHIVKTVGEPVTVRVEGEAPRS